MSAASDSSDSEVEISEAILNILRFHTNRGASFVDDARDFTRSWRHRLRDIVLRENEKYVKFLEKSPHEWPGVVEHNSFFTELGRQVSSLGTSWIDKHINPIIDKSAINEEIGSEVLRNQIVQMMDNYLATLNKVFEHHASLEHKIHQITRIKSQIENIDCLESDTSDEAKELQVSALKFLESKYKALSIDSDYVAFCKEYARFQAYRSILGVVQAGSDINGSPICSICTSGTVASALVPCGHVYCNTCAQKQRSQCYICRTSVKTTLRIYFN